MLRGTHLDIHIDDTDTVAAPTFDNMLKEQRDAGWRNLSVNPKICVSEGASLCICSA